MPLTGPLMRLPRLARCLAVAALLAGVAGCAAVRPQVTDCHLRPRALLVPQLGWPLDVTAVLDGLVLTLACRYGLAPRPVVNARRGVPADTGQRFPGVCAACGNATSMCGCRSRMRGR